MRIKFWTWAILAALFLAGCDSGDNDFVITGDGSATEVRSTTEQEFGMVYLTQGAANVDIEILPIGSDQVLGRVRTNAAGVFLIPPGTRLPGEFRLSVQTPEGVVAERYVAPGDLPYLFVNGVSSLMSRYKALHPELSLAEIEAKVRSGLAIGEGGLYATNDSVSSSFSHTLFLRQAESAGGLNVFLTSLVGRLEAGEIVSFRGDQTGPAVGTLLQRTPEVRAQFGEIGAALGGWLLEQTAGKIFDEVSYRLTGKVNGAAGTSFGSAGSFEEVSEELGEIETTITSFDSKIDATFLESSAARIATNLGDDVTSIDTATSAIQTLANQASSAFASDPESADHGPLIPPSGLTAAVEGLAFLTSSTALADFSNAFTSTSSTTNIFYATNLAASAGGTASANSSSTPGGKPSGAFNNTSPDESYGYYDLRNDLVTVTLLDNLTVNLGYLTKLANLISEDANLAYLPTVLSAGTGFAPPSIKLNNAVDQLAELYGPTLHEAAYWVPMPVGTDLVLMDLKNQLMWYLPASLGEYNDAQNGMIGLNPNGWSLPAGVTPPAKVGDSVSKDLVGFTRSSTMTGWRLPELSELETLRGQVIAAGGGTASDDAVLNGLTNLGFTGLNDLLDHTNYKKFWYNGSVVELPGNKGEIAFYYLDFTKGQTQSGIVATPFNREDPSYSYVYVRTLNITTDNYFGDTTQQIYKCYGRSPDSYTAERLIVGDPTLATMVDYQVAAYHSDIEQVTSNNQVQDWLVTTVELPTGSNSNDPNDEASDIAYIIYVDNTSGPSNYIPPNGPGGTTRPRLIFKKPGTVVVRFTSFDPSNPAPASLTLTETSTVRPRLQSIRLSPQNVAFTVNPTSGSEQFYTTGYLANGLTVDLTRNANTVYSPFGPSSGPQLPWTITNGNDKGLMTFIGGAAYTDDNQIRSYYSHGGDAGQTWSDGGVDQQDFATFSFPGLPPVITTLSPTFGPAGGGTLITLQGSGFSGATSVTVNGVAGLNFVVNTDSELTFTTPASPSTGIVPIVVTTPNGTSSANFSYQ